MTNDEHLQFVNHELRNALGPLMNSIEILKWQGADPPTIAIMERQVAQILAIMDEQLRGKGGSARSV